MIYIEQDINLFTLPREYMLAHCISSDYVLGAGIAAQFRKRFDMATKLKLTGTCYSWCSTGRCVIIDMDGNFKSVTPKEGVFRVANLVTKQAFYNKPTLLSIEEALRDLKQQLQEVPEYRKIKRIGMPKIGSGLDMQKWEAVSAIIQDVFGDMDIEVRICTKKSALF